MTVKCYICVNIHSNPITGELLAQFIPEEIVNDLKKSKSKSAEWDAEEESFFMPRRLDARVIELPLEPNTKVRLGSKVRILIGVISGVGEL